MKKVLLCLLVLVVLILKTSISSYAQKARTVRLNHIALYVKNLKTSTDFYTNIIGLDTMPEPFHDGRHAWLPIAENSHLHIIQGATSITDHDKNAHVCFTVPSVEEFVKVLQQEKIPYEDWAGKSNSITLRVDGVKQVYFQDPDKYWIEINDAKY